MFRIIVDRYSLKEFKIADYTRNNSPRHWPDVVRSMSQTLFGSDVGHWDYNSIFTSSDILFSWLPSVEILLASFFGKRYIYLCWGGLGRIGLLGLFEKNILKNASLLLVNDPTTQKEIYEISRRDAVIIPYCVDSDFFIFGDFQQRDNYFFCCSTNDRNPSVLLDLAKAGNRVVWSTHIKIAEIWRNRHPNLEVVSNLSWKELATHYQKCAAFILPLVGDNHAAGQTTMLEAISSGAPVFVSPNRASKIFENLPSVIVVNSNTEGFWEDTIIQSFKNVDLNSATQISRKHVEKFFSIDASICALTSILSLKMMLKIPANKIIR
jgi:glycosyltransferase involved in cell wall biosynthesis